MFNWFKNYPDTDFHELNLDWLIGEWQKVRDTYDQWDVKIKNLEEAFDALKDFVTYYFDNLDVQTEINNKLDEMFLDGSLDILLQRVVDVSQVMDLDPVLQISRSRHYWDYANEAYYPTFLQAACTDGVAMFLFFMNPVNQGKVLIEKWDISTKQLLGSNTINNGDHANCADYYNGNIYLASITSGIHVIDPLSLQITDIYF